MALISFMKLSHLTIARRLQIISIAALVGMIGVAMVGLIDLHNSLMAGRENKVQSIVESAIAILASYDHRATQGEMTPEEAKRRALLTLQAMRYGDDGYVFVLDQDGVTRAHPNPTRVGQNNINAMDPDGVPYTREMINRAAQGGGFVAYRFPRAGQTTPLAKISYAAPFQPWGLIIATGIYVDDVEVLFWHNAKIIGAFVGGLLILVVGGTTRIARSISGPLARTTDAVARLARGDTEITIAYTDHRDEIGDLTRALEVFRQHMIAAERLAQDQCLAQSTRQQRADRIESFIRDFEPAMASVVAGVAAAGTQLHADAQTLACTADQTNRQSVAVAAAAEQATGNVQTVAAATEQLTASVGEIGRQVTESARIADTAVEEANRTNTTVASLSDAARKIGDIVQLINTIASQTNLLALNATIEAARAGDAGKGFAVVASEVKTLANQTAKATDDIQAQVNQMQAVTSSAVAAIKGISGTIHRMSDITTTIAASVAQQGLTAQDIARNVAQASQGTIEVSGNIGEVTEAAGSTGTMATQILSAAANLNQQATRLQSEVDLFVHRVRVA